MFNKNCVLTFLHIFADNPVQPSGDNIHRDSKLLKGCIAL